VAVVVGDVEGGVGGGDLGDGGVGWEGECHGAEGWC
jgi:hypothetical protein